jgi:hypothetical protein
MASVKEATPRPCGVLRTLRGQLRDSCGGPARIILERADSGSFDVIIMGHRGYGCAKSLLVGSVAVKVIARSPIPVLVFRRSPRPSLKAFKRGRLKRPSRARPTSEVLPVGRLN